MAVSYTLTAQRAWSRMVRMLFRPFHLETWAVLGFAAFLSEYLSRPSGGGPSWQVRGKAEIPEIARHAAAFLLHPIWGALALLVLLALCVAVLVFLWLSSRGKFIFLDGVVRERAAIVEPWKRFARRGNSLFAFRLALTLIVVAVVIAISLPLLPSLLGAVSSGGDWKVLLAVFALWWVAAMLPFLLLVACLNLFLDQFVVPIMYRDDLGVIPAWGRFYSLFARNAASFLFFALLYLVAGIAVGSAIAAAGLATCCVGFVLLAIPYVGSVILLPVEVTFRGLGPDFLDQFGPEWSVFARAPEPSPPGPATGAGA